MWHLGLRTLTSDHWHIRESLFRPGIISTVGLKLQWTHVSNTSKEKSDPPVPVGLALSFSWILAITYLIEGTGNSEMENTRDKPVGARDSQQGKLSPRVPLSKGHSESQSASQQTEQAWWAGLERPLLAVVKRQHPALGDPMDCSLLCPGDFPGKNTGVGCHFLLQEESPPRNRTHVSYIGRQILYHWATWEAPGLGGSLPKAWRWMKETLYLKLHCLNASHPSLYMHYLFKSIWHLRCKYSAFFPLFKNFIFYLFF